MEEDFDVKRDPRPGVHPDAILPDVRTISVATFTIDQVAFVYGSKWKQRYFTKVGDDDYPLPAQWDVGNREWLKYIQCHSRGRPRSGLIECRAYDWPLGYQAGLSRLVQFRSNQSLGSEVIVPRLCLRMSDVAI